MVVGSLLLGTFWIGQGVAGARRCLTRKGHLYGAMMAQALLLCQQLQQDHPGLPQRMIGYRALWQARREFYPRLCLFVLLGPLTRLLPGRKE